MEPIILGSISTEMYKALKLEYKTLGGAIATVDGIPTIEVSSPSGTATFIQDEDGINFKVLAGDVSELVNVKTKGDADLGEGVREIVLEYIIPVTTPEADATKSGATEVGTGLKSELV